jgi:NitT/TauT family transport system substrate-binding protein
VTTAAGTTAATTAAGTTAAATTAAATTAAATTAARTTAAGGGTATTARPAGGAAGTTAAPAVTTAAAATTAAATAPAATGPGTTTAQRVPGCGSSAFVNPAILSAGRPYARCEANAPAPQRLPQREKIRVSNSFAATFVAPLLLAQEFGEFEKENLEVEVVNLSFANAIPQMATGQIQIATGGTEAGFFNAVNSGIDIKWAMGNFVPPNAGDLTAPQTGLWARADIFSNPSNPNLAELRGKTLASAVGLGSVIAYPIGQALRNAGLDIADMRVQTVPSPDMVTALRNRAVDAAWLLDPFWSQAAQDPQFIMLATQPPGEPLGGYYYSGTFVRDRRPAALAFTRAIIRTINTYLAGDLRSDPRVVDTLARLIRVTPESIRGIDQPRFDWEIRADSTTRIQGFFLAYNAVNYRTALPEDRVVDRSLYREVVGAT